MDTSRLREEKVDAPRRAAGMPAFFAAFAAAQLELENPTRNTRGQARGNRNYRYADLASVVGVLQEVLGSHGLCFLQPVLRVGDEMVVRTIVAHAEGYFMQWDYPLDPWPKAPQEQGSAITYARRYQLMSVFGLAPDDDDGKAAQKAAEARRTPPQRERRPEPPRRQEPPPRAPQAAQKPRPYNAREWVDAAKPLQPDEVAWYALVTGKPHPEKAKSTPGLANFYSWCSENHETVTARLKDERLHHNRHLRARLADSYPVLTQKSGAKPEDIQKSKERNERAYRNFIAAAFGVERGGEIAPWRIYGVGAGSRGWLRNDNVDHVSAFRGAYDITDERKTEIAAKALEDDERLGWVAP